MAGTPATGSLRATRWAERGLLTLSAGGPGGRRQDFLACRHHVEACHRHHVVCRHHAASSLGAVRTDSALFVCPNPPIHGKLRIPTPPEGRR